ncbi:MAG: hypothetical protein QOD73_530, partial [Solirubrobacteraceae bacterium]|nr:hypothetical protein [Solirubrobacteraceae bacterium]
RCSAPISDPVKDGSARGGCGVGTHVQPGGMTGQADG